MLEVTVKVWIGCSKGEWRGTRDLGDNAQVYRKRPFKKAVIESIKDLWRGEIADVVITY